MGCALWGSPPPEAEPCCCLAGPSVIATAASTSGLLEQHCGTRGCANVFVNPQRVFSTAEEESSQGLPTKVKLLRGQLTARGRGTARSMSGLGRWLSSLRPGLTAPGGGVLHFRLCIRSPRSITRHWEALAGGWACWPQRQGPFLLRKASLASVWTLRGLVGIWGPGSFQREKAKPQEPSRSERTLGLLSRSRRGKRCSGTAREDLGREPLPTTQAAAILHSQKP